MEKTTDIAGQHTHSYTKHGDSTGASGSAWLALSGSINATTSSSGAHSHAITIGAHTHTVSGTIGKSGNSNEINITNAFITLMGWYRTH